MYGTLLLYISIAPTKLVPRLTSLVGAEDKVTVPYHQQNTTMYLSKNTIHLALRVCYPPMKILVLHGNQAS